MLFKAPRHWCDLLVLINNNTEHEKYWSINRSICWLILKCSVEKAVCSHGEISAVLIMSSSQTCSRLLSLQTWNLSPSHWHKQRLERETNRNHPRLTDGWRCFCLHRCLPEMLVLLSNTTVRLCLFKHPGRRSVSACGSKCFRTRVDAVRDGTPTHQIRQHDASATADVAFVTLLLKFSLSQ